MKSPLRAAALIFLFIMMRKGPMGWMLPRSARLVRRCLFSSEAVEVVLVGSHKPATAMRLLQKLRPQLQIHPQLHHQVDLGVIWSMHRGGINLDSVELEDYYLGPKRLSDEDIAHKWNEMLNERLRYLNTPDYSVQSYGEGEILKRELQAAVGIVQKSSNVVRSLQRSLLRVEGGAGLSKGDNTPVTIADLAIQALVIDALSEEFPGDTFIAEEDSTFVRQNTTIRRDVLTILAAATGSSWAENRLYVALDRGSSKFFKEDQERRRVWVLDPIDGTKGFIRGEHCCTGLALLLDGQVALSALGCPNLNLRKLLQSSNVGTSDMYGIQSPLAFSDDDTRIFHPDSGSVYFAVTGQGAFARSLSMPLGAAYEVSTSTESSVQSARLCESAEAAFGDRVVTARTAEMLDLQNEFIRVDGMCKHCLVGIGAAEATLRLPPSGYVEKIWDHAAGDHFVREAGGTVTDLRGERLDYTAVLSSDGRTLSESVEGVVVSNALLHDRIFSAVLKARNENKSSP